MEVYLNYGIKYVGHKKIIKSMKRILLTFNSSNYKRGNKKLFDGTFSKYFDEIINYDENDLDSYILNIVKEIFELTQWNRGFGYWIWKPYIISQELKKLKSGDILFYLDSHFNFNDESLIEQITEDLKKDKNGLFWGNDASSNDIEWTTPYLVNAVETELNYKFSYDELMQEHGDAGLLFIKKNRFTVNFFKKWFDIMIKHKLEISDHYNSKAHELNNNFKENRHDQSVFNLMVKYYKLISPRYILYWQWGSE